MAAVLTSWKEIAAYLGKSIRTVQRWERELGLPVRRPDLRRSGIVLADPAELDSWLHRQTTLPVQEGAQPANGDGETRLKAARVLHVTHERFTELRHRSNATMERTRTLYQRLEVGVERLRSAIQAHRATTEFLRGRVNRRSQGQPAA